MKRVVITGLGAITPIGIGKEAFWNSLIEGKSGVGPITRFDTADFDCKIAAEVKDYDANDYLDKKEAKRMDRFTQFAVVATKLAIEDGKINLDDINLERVGTIIGCGIGGLETL